MMYKLGAAFLIFTILYATMAGADVDLSGGSLPDFSLRGYGTLGIAHADTNTADVVRSFTQPDGAGYSHDWSASVDSRLGVQLDARFNNRLSAVVQVLSQRHYDESYTPEIEWANLKFAVTPEFFIRVGRTAASLFITSDSRQVGYTYLWARPPTEVYDLVAVTNKDGIEAGYQFWQDGIFGSVELSYANSDLKLSGNKRVEAESIFNIHSTLEYHSTSILFNYSSLKLSFESEPLSSFLGGITQLGGALAVTPGLQATGAQVFAIANEYNMRDQPSSFVAIGVNYDEAPWRLIAEWGKITLPGFTGDRTGWSTTVGYRIDKFTPYLVLADLRSDTPPLHTIPTAGLPLPLAQAATQLNEAIGMTIDGFKTEQRTVSFGVRWDVMRSASIKFQYDHMSFGAGSTGQLVNVQPGFQSSDDIQVFSAVIDFVF